MLLATLLGLVAAAPPSPHHLPGPDPTTTVVVDSSRHELVITTGPFFLPAMAGPAEHLADHGMTHDSPVERFTWPVDGWLRGFRFEILDREGRPLPRHLVHHAIILNFDRRQLLYGMAERVFGVGSETADASIPRSIGIPFSPSTRMGLYVAWHNDTGADLDGVTLRVTMQWIPLTQVPRPLDVLPLYMDVNLTVGGSNTFDVPPGRSTQAWDFTLPADGRLLGVSGHLHKYGRVVRLEDAESGKVLTRVQPKLDREGNVTGMDRRLFGVWGRGLKLRAGHRYRVVTEYLNPTGHTLQNGGMAHMVGLFAPDDMAQLPSIDPSDPDYQRDLASLEQRGGMADHAGH